MNRPTRTLALAAFLFLDRPVGTPNIARADGPPAVASGYSIPTIDLAGQADRQVVVDREKAGLSGVTVEDVGRAIIPATSSTRFVSVNYWVDVKTGFDYLVEVVMPPTEMTEPSDIETLPIEPVNSLVNLMVRDVATVRQSTEPGERRNSRNSVRVSSRNGRGRRLAMAVVIRYSRRSGPGPGAGRSWR